MAVSKKGRTLAAPATVSIGAPADVETLLSVSMSLAGVFVGSYQAEASFDLGASFAPIGAALTAPGVVAVPDGAHQVRWNCTAHTSGSPVGAVGGVG